MTVCGIIARQNMALAWADTDQFAKSGKRLAPVNKVHANATALLASVGAGWGDLSRRIAYAATSAASLEEAAIRIGSALRDGAEKMSRNERMDPRGIAGHVEYLTGWSRRTSCFLGYEMVGSTAFLPRVVSCAASPWIDEVAALDPLDPLGLIDVVRKQLAELHEEHPEATGGTLSVALLRPGQITTGPLCNLEALPGDGWLWPGMRRAPEQVEAEESADG